MSTKTEHGHATSETSRATASSLERTLPDEGSSPLQLRLDATPLLAREHGIHLSLGGESRHLHADLLRHIVADNDKATKRGAAIDSKQTNQEIQVAGWNEAHLSPDAKAELARLKLEGTPLELVHAVATEQIALGLKGTGKVDRRFQDRLGVILPDPIAPATVDDKTLEQIKTQSPDGVSVAIYMNFDPKAEATRGADRPFRQGAEEFATKYHAVGLRDGALTVGAAIAIRDRSDIIEAVQSIHRGLAAGQKDGVPAYAKIKNLAIFTHGLEYGLALTPQKHTYPSGIHKKIPKGELGAENPSNVDSLVNGLGNALASDVRVLVFACSTANDPTARGEGSMPKENATGGEHSFAGELNASLHAHGVAQASVYGHATEGHTTENPNARVFGHDAGSDEAHAGQHMFNQMFPGTFIDAELQRLLPTVTTMPAPEQAKLRTELRELIYLYYRDQTGVAEKLPEPNTKKMGMEMLMRPTKAAEALRTGWKRTLNNRSRSADTATLEQYRSVLNEVRRDLKHRKDLGRSR